VTTDEVVTALLATASEFERSAPRIDLARRADIAERFIDALDKSSLSNAEMERRLSIVLPRLGGVPDVLRSIAIAGNRARNGVLRNAISAQLPAEYRQLVHRAKAAEVAARPKHVHTSAMTSRHPVSDDDGGYRVVVILSVAIDPAVRALLEGSRFEPLRFDSLVALGDLLESTADICAFLIESSFLEGLDPEEQRELFRRIGKYSTFAVVRCHDTALKLTRADVGRIIALAQCTVSPPGFDRLSFAERQILREADLDSLVEARAGLSFGRVGRFLPDEISSTQLQLLGAAMASYARRKRFNSRSEFSALSVRFLQGGAGAKVALVRVDELPWPVIVKVDKYDEIEQEALRFKTFVEARDRELHPEVHLHGGAALIIFDIIASVDSERTTGTATVAPAPSLGSVLTEFWSSEIFGTPCGHNAEAVTAATVDAAQRLAVLNMLPCETGRFEIRANPHIACVKKLESSGFDWGFDRDAITARERAEALLQSMEAASICHGDAHIDNILIRDRYGHVIDYAYSGPGHPCSDLTKLELSIFFRAFHPFGTEDDIAQLQRDLSNFENDAAQLLRRHSTLMKSRTNELCIRLCVAVRDRVAPVLLAHGMKSDHYWAAKLLQAWQSLQLANLPQSMVRIVIRALSTP
jgi:Phosphotransferase enzyme family